MTVLPVPLVPVNVRLQPVVIVDMVIAFRPITVPVLMVWANWTCKLGVFANFLAVIMINMKAIQPTPVQASIAEPN
jgi:hypothetical protein